MSDETEAVEDNERPDEPLRIPAVSTSSGGRISRMMETLASLYRNNNLGMDCRWVYSPEHRSDLSNVLTRMAQGYKPILVSELGQEVPGFDDANGKVRVGDTVLMGIPTQAREEIIAELSSLAQGQVDAITEGYENAINAASDGHRGDHKAVPRGRVLIEERTAQYDQEQRTS